jgi:hypothetical protein
MRELAMAGQKLGIGDAFPSLTLNLVSGDSLTVPGGMNSKYRVVLFYRGHW